MAGDAWIRRPVTQWCQRLTLAALAVVAGWWLFSDTVYHHSRRDDTLGPPWRIRFAHFGSYQDYQLWQDVIEAFESANSGIRVRQEYIPGWYGRYNAKIRQQILSGTLPHVVMMQLGPFTELADHFAALDSLIAKDDSASRLTSRLDETAVRAFSTNQLRGLPIAGGNLLIYCNPDCFDKAGIGVTLPEDDWTMDEFADLARQLTRDDDGDGRNDQFGFWLPRWVYYLPFLWSFGAEIVDDTGSRWMLTDPPARDALAFYRDLMTTWKVCPQPGDLPQLIQDVAFLTGKVAMCVNGPWFQPFLERTRLRDSYHVAHIPIGPGGRLTRVTWDGLCISNDLTALETDAAWRFVRFCVTKPIQDMIAESGRSIPALRASLPAFDRHGTDTRRRKFIDALSYASLQPRIQRFSEIDRVMDRHLRRLIAADSTISPEQLLANLARDPVIVDVFHNGSAP